MAAVPAGKPGAINWAQLNPFARADRGQLTPENPPALRREEPIQDDIDPATGKAKVKPNPQGGDDPLLNFDSLWQPNVGEDGKPIVEDNTPKGYLPQLDPKKFQEMLGKANFAGDITAEDVAKLKAGGDDAPQVMISLMNKVARRSFATSMAAMQKMAEQGFSTANERFMSQVPDHVREMMTENELSGSVTIMKNPAFAPMVNMVKRQYLSKFPKATPNEVNAAVSQYFTAMGTELTKKAPGKQDIDLGTNASKLKRGAPDADFMEWAGAELAPGMFNLEDDTQTE